MMNYKSIICTIFLLIGLCFIVASCGQGPTDSHPQKNNSKPEITSFSPPKGPIGTVVVVRGRNFSSTKSDNTVTFGTKEAKVISANISELKFKVPEDVKLGNAAISVTVNGKTDKASKTFSVKSPPQISTFSPSQGPVWETVVIKGQHFSPTASRDTVKFGNTVARVDSATLNRLQVNVPNELDSGKVAISVSIGAQTAIASSKFAVKKHNYSSKYPYNLNVVYFVPNDVTPRPQYKKRISEILLNIRAFYRKWMKHWGYGDRTFGLLVDQDHQRVKIFRINGKKSHTAYLNNGGGGAEMKEVKAFFRRNPDEQSSDHFLVITPTSGYGVPYYGLGFGWAFIADIKGMNLDVLKNGGNNKYIGGTTHELAHGLNLPHDSYKVSEHNKYGMALMDAGNYTYGEKPTFLTKASCAILAKNQIFSKTKGSFYGSVNASIKKLSGHFKNGNIIVNGKFKSNIPVSSVIIYNDPAGRSNYNAVPWATTPIAADSFHVQMPVNQLPDHSNKSYSLYIRFVFKNGRVKKFSGSDYAFVNSKPNINFERGAQ